MATASRIYARALYDAVAAQGGVASARADLEQLAAAIEGSPELAAFLANPQVEPASKASALDDLSEGADPLVRNALRLVASRGRASELRAIVRSFEEIVDRAERRLVVELQTAQPLTDEEAAAIVRRIEEASGRTVEATRSVDPSLVGGLVLQAGSLRADASVRGRLERLRRDLVTR